VAGIPEAGLSVVEHDTVGLPVRLVLLHGFGRYHGHLLDLWSGLDVACPVAAVQAGFRIGPGAYRWFAYEDRPDGSVTIDTDEERRSRVALLAYLDALRGREPRRRLFLLGHSQGGMMALSVALLRPGLVAGCAVLNARILPETLRLLPASPELSGLPVFVGHGRADAVVPVAKGRSARDALTRMGAEVAYREYDGDHEVTVEMVAEVADWLRTCLTGPRENAVRR
jgi:phospholipase/carboxylesterase